MLRGAAPAPAAALARAAGWDATVHPRFCVSCKLQLMPSQWHTCCICKYPLHGKIVADISGVCVVKNLATDDSLLLCCDCARSNPHLVKKTDIKVGEGAFAAALSSRVSQQNVDKSVTAAVKSSKTAFSAAALVPSSKKTPATVPNTVRNMASSTDAFTFLMGRTGAAPRDSSAAVTAVAATTAVAVVAAVAAVAVVASAVAADAAFAAAVAGDYSSATKAAIIDDEGRTCANDIAPPESIPLNVVACLSHYNLDMCKTYKEAGIFYKSALKVQYYPLSITCFYPPFNDV